MNFNNQFRMSPDPDGTGGGGESAEALAAQLAAAKAEEAKLSKQVRDQNAYITKLESEKKTVPASPVNVVQPAASTIQSSAEKYAINAATNEAIANSTAILKQKYGEEAFSAIKDDFVNIARANIKDPFNIPEGLFDKAARMALGTAFDDETRRTKILGAYSKTAQQPAPVVPQTKQVVIDNPGSQKIGVMQPGDTQNLGKTEIVTGPTTTPTKMSPSEFFKSARSKK